MLGKILYITILILALVLPSRERAHAQVLVDTLATDSIPAPRFASERDSLFFYFPETFGRRMGNEGNANAVQAARELLRFWDEDFGVLSEEEKNFIFDFTYKAWEKGFQASPDLSTFFLTWWNSLNGVGLDQAALQQYLSVGRQLLDSYDRAAWLRFINGFDLFWKQRSLYNLASHQLLFEDSIGFQLHWIEAPMQQRFNELPLRDSYREQIGKISYAEQPQPVLIVNEGSLYVIKGRDSLMIEGTKGTFYLLSQQWIGEGGRIDWSMAGYEPEQVITELQSYLLRPTHPELRAENTLLYYPERIAVPAAGSFEYRTLRTAEGRLDYPRFTSYAKDVELRIKSETEFVYRGGISLVAKSLKSSLEPGELATVSVWHGGEKRLQAGLAQIDFLDSLVTSPNGRVVIYHGVDSIYHNSIQFRYHPYHSELTLVKDRSNFRRSPYVSSHFRVDIFSDMLKWNTATDKVHFQILSSNDVVPAIIESHDYFDMATYVSISNLYDFHPLVVLVNYAREINNSNFFMEALMRKTGKSREVIQNLLMNLAAESFIEYEPETGEITMLRKGFHYVLSSQRQKDFDRIRIESISRGGSNVILDIGINSMDIKGVSRFAINEQKGIFIKPKNQSITLAGNRDINFDGAMSAGNYEFAGEQIKFSYEDFRVDLPKIDTIQMAVTKSRVSEAGPVLEQAKVHNQMRQTSGSIILDDPKNKSARRSTPAFPSFESTGGSTLYFNSPGILNGAYDERLYVEIPPFRIDSADTKDASRLRFDGRFVGGGVMDDFDVTVFVKPDNSFGFVKELPESGWSIHNGKAKIFDQVNMSIRGLEAFGRASMLNGTISFDTLTIFTDSLYAERVQFDFPSFKGQGYNVPAMTGYSPEFRWNTAGDSLQLYTDSLSRFNLFQDKVAFEGQLLLTAAGTTGKGFLSIFDGDLMANAFRMGSDFITADSATLVINSELEGLPLMRGKNLLARFDNTSNTVGLLPENGISEVLEFPFTNLKTEMASATWNIDDNIIDIKSPEGLDGTSRFVAERGNGDDLVIDAAGAVYDLNQKEILISGIAKIPVADAYLTPAGGRLAIKESADISEFKNATMVFDTINQWHKIVEADVTIISKTRFDASGYYQYTNDLGNNYKIRFDSFQWRTENDARGRPMGYTFGAGYVSEKDQLELSPKIFFKGDVVMKAFKPALEMNGFIKFELQSFPNNKAWISYSSDGSETGINVDLEKSVTEFGTPISAGLHIGMAGMYGTFMSDKKDDFDHDLFKPKGQLSFDTKSGSYSIKDEEAANKMALAQTSYTLNDETGALKWEGKHTFMEKNTAIQMEAGAKGEGNLRNNQYSLKGLYHLQLNTPAALLDTIGYALKNFVEINGLPPAILDKTSMAYNLAHIIGEAPARTWEQGSMLRSSPIFTASEKISRGIIFNDLTLNWSADKKALYGQGTVSLSNFNRKDINAEADAFLEIKKTGFGDTMDLLLRLANNAWVYFRWNEDALLVYSSFEMVNTYAEEKSNFFSAPQGVTVFEAARLSDAKGFLERFIKTYTGTGEIPELDMETAPTKAKKRSGF